MAENDEWIVGEDGCLSVGEPLQSVTYHSTLNTILVSSKEPTIKVIDVASGSVLQTSNLSGWNSDCLLFFAPRGKKKPDMFSQSLWFGSGFWTTSSSRHFPKGVSQLA